MLDAFDSDKTVEERQFFCRAFEIPEPGVFSPYEIAHRMGQFPKLRKRASYTAT